MAFDRVVYETCEWMRRRRKRVGVGAIDDGDDGRRDGDVGATRVHGARREGDGRARSNARARGAGDDRDAGGGATGIRDEDVRRA